ncbi:hypothetical protein [Streptomyces sp. KL110A]|uniref:hypothetical protein n=1 Tax=Streptomyces sp. KL110A TaxID=3384221 RepID=UPI0038C3ED77
MRLPRGGPRMTARAFRPAGGAIATVSGPPSSAPAATGPAAPPPSRNSRWTGIEPVVSVPMTFFRRGSRPTAATGVATDATRIPVIRPKSSRSRSSLNTPTSGTPGRSELPGAGARDLPATGAAAGSAPA